MTEPHPQRCPPQENGNRIYCIFEEQLFCLMRGWTHTSFSDPKNIISAIIEDNPLCASHSSVHPQSEQCPHWVSSDNLKSDFRDQNIGEFYCNKLQQSEQEIRKDAIEKVLDILHDKVPIYPSYLGDLMLVSDIEEELRSKQGEP